MKLPVGLKMFQTVYERTLFEHSLWTCAKH